MPAAEISDRELRLLRLRSQGLLPESAAVSLTAAAKGSFCLQAQDVAAASLAVRARTEGLTAASAARQAARGSVCRAWLMRNTIHLFATRDLAWMRPLLAERPRRPAVRRLEQLGVPEAALKHALAALRKRVAKGPIPRAEALELVREAGVRAGEGNNALYWVLHLATVDGVVVVRPALDRKQTFVPAPKGEALARDEALGRLARRFLQAYAPASPGDLAYWAKVPLGDARRGWEAAGRLASVETSVGTLAALPATLRPLANGGPSVRLLGLWDNYLLGYADRELAVPRPTGGRVHPGGGLLKPTAFADGCAFGTWRLERQRRSVVVAVEPFDRVPRGARTGLEREVADIGRFLEVEAMLRIERG